LYFYNDKWQVLTETDASETMKAWYAYGNYIDEVLLMAPIPFAMLTRCYVHDHLYSPAALTTANGTVQERYEYDAYGRPYVLEPNFADDPDGASDYSNPYYFTGRRVDFLDSGNLTLQHNRHRYYDYDTGRWTTHDPRGIDPGVESGYRVSVLGQYTDGLDLYEYVSSNPLASSDAYGKAKCGDCKESFRRVPWRRPHGPVPDWIYWGETRTCEECMKAELTLSSKGCAGGCPCEGACRAIRIRECKCTIRGKYYYPAPDWMRDKEGNSPKGHEMKHAARIKAAWAQITRVAKMVEGWRCMCFKAASCYKQAFNKEFMDAIVKSCEIENYDFDCKVYRERTKKEREKKQVRCNLRDTARNEFFTLIRELYLKLRKCGYLRASGAS
jgi:RHS repeat-associated protein